MQLTEFSSGNVTQSLTLTAIHMSSGSYSPKNTDRVPLLGSSSQPSLHKSNNETHSAQRPQTHQTPQTHTKPPPRRRLTFTGPAPVNLNPHAGRSSLYESSMDMFDHHGDDFEVTDALGQIQSRSNSSANLAGHHTYLRDLRNFESQAASGSKPRPYSNVRRSSRIRSSTSTENPFVNAGLGQGSSPSFAERWVSRQNQINQYGSIGNQVAIDIDKLQANSTMFTDPNKSQRGDDSDLSDFDSNPSSRHSDGDSSLDDVCFPVDNMDYTEGVRKWPDLQVLEEFYEEETTRLKDEALKETSEANFRFDVHNDQDDISTNDNTSGVGFSYPIVTKVDAPPTSKPQASSPPLNTSGSQYASRLLGNQKINETETLNGRLRPPKINPFDKRRVNNADFLRTINYPPQIVNNNPEHFRFTYFREDLDSTVHSPTISGLLQPGQKFSDLFVHSEYSKDQRKSTPSASTKLGATPTPTANSNTHSMKGSTPELKPLEELLIQEEEATTSGDERVSPFWLDILNPTEEEMKVISKAFAIHPLTTEDIYLGETREKVELFKDYYFVCFRSFDIVQEKAKRREIKLKEVNNENDKRANSGFFSKFFGRRQSSAKSMNSNLSDSNSQTSSFKRHAREIELEKFQRKSGDRHKPKNNELEPLNVYILVFRHAVITFHFAPTPHPVNVRRRARLLNEYLTVSADWIAYALIDDITDAFGPMIESIEDEVNEIEDAILHMNDDSDSDSSDDESDYDNITTATSLRRRKSTGVYMFDDKRSIKSVSTQSTRSTASNVIEWKKKGDMLKRIGETRKRVMSLLRLLGSKADVIKGFAKRCNEQWEVAPRSEIGMYLGDIQDHIVTMVQSLNHYEKLLARSHSNYLAQINIDMTKVNNDMNDVLGKITILGTVVLPMNIVTGLWGMNVIVPGQEHPGLIWFWCITAGMVIFAFSCYMYAKRVAGIGL